MTQIMSKGVGIDLGTTNSVVAVMNPSDTEIILHRDRNSRWPTMAAIKQNQQLTLWSHNREMLEIVIEFPIADIGHELGERLLGAV